MSKTREIDPDDPVEVFTGTTWEVALVQSLLENAEIKVWVYCGGEGTLAPLDSVGGLPMNRITVAGRDYEKAHEVIVQYREAMNKDTSKTPELE